MLVPRLTTAQRTAVSSPATGLLVFDSTPGSFWFYNGTAWTELVASTDGLGSHTATANIQLNDHWLSNDGGDEGLRVNNSGNVGIGTALPLEKLHLSAGNFLVSGVYGSGSAISASGTGTRMFFYPKKAAFRAGDVEDDQWDDGNVGDYSFATGSSNIASGETSFAAGNYGLASGFAATAFGSECVVSGDESFAAGSSNEVTGRTSVAFGSQNTASGITSVGMGYESVASGDYAVAIGESVEAASRAEIVVGTYNTTYTPASTTGFDNSGRLFTVGNGTASFNRSDAMVILKSGSVGIGTASPGQKLEVNGTTKTVGFQMPTGATTGYLLQSDGNGNGSWVSPASLSVAYAETDPQVISATTNLIPRWNGSVLTDGSIVDNGTSIGIGTTSPANKLDVEGGLAVGSTYSGASTAPTNGAIVEGNVGIGTSSPTNKLEVNGTTKTTSLQITSGAATGYVGICHPPIWVLPVAATPTSAAVPPSSLEYGW